jgi:hypothetical protein
MGLAGDVGLAGGVGLAGDVAVAGGVGPAGGVVLTGDEVVAGERRGVVVMALPLVTVTEAEEPVGSLSRCVVALTSVASGSGRSCNRSKRTLDKIAKPKRAKRIWRG